MPSLNEKKGPPDELLLGRHLNDRVPKSDQQRQRAEVEEILRRLRSQPGVILADEVGMGKTFVAMAVAYSVAIQNPRGPVIVMVPANLVDKWEQDLKTFCELYLDDRIPLKREEALTKELSRPRTLRYGVARHSVEFMRLLDDPPRSRCHIIFLAQGAMARRQSDKWIRLGLIAEALRRHGRGGASRLIQVKKQIHRFLAELLWAIGEERANDWGDDLWQQLLKSDTSIWKDTYNSAVRNERRRLSDDPVPKSVARALHRIDLKGLAKALEQVPIRARGGGDRVSERLNIARTALRQSEELLWRDLLAESRWRSPLLVMDEAHHLKNPGTSLARQLQSPDLEHDLRTGDGAMAHAFDRMLFLTATPFQLGHHELVSVLKRFGDVRWDASELGDREAFLQQMHNLQNCLNESQRSAIALQRSWSRMRLEDCDDEVEVWWKRISVTARDFLNHYQRAVIDAFVAAKLCRDAAQKSLHTWVVRHNKPTHWADTAIARRERLDGSAVIGQSERSGLPVPPEQLLPFFLAARSAVNPRQDLLGEALCSSYEAFRYTRKNRDSDKDDQEPESEATVDMAHSRWYLQEFDRALDECSGATHPKIDATVQKVVDLWESGEKVLVFAFYRHTCRALRIHISQEIEQRLEALALRRLQGSEAKDIDQLLSRIQKRYFDDLDSPGRRAVDSALNEIMRSHSAAIDSARVTQEQRSTLVEVMRRFLRVPTTLVRCFPIAKANSIDPDEAVAITLRNEDQSGLSWRQKFDGFIRFLTSGCSSDERQSYLEAAKRTQTGGIRVDEDEDEDHGENASSGRVTLANVQVAMGTTRRDTRARLMRAFNTPFFPDILVCSQVMGEGVDLQRFCRHVIHHDLDWNPSTIEQRTGRLDRLGCKAEGLQSIMVYLPYLAGTADERQYKVMSDRERWFRVVMGQDEVAKLITPDSSLGIPLPESVSDELGFKLGVDGF